MIIYKTINLINKKFYIGKDKYNNQKYFGSGKLLKQAIKKYGINNFKKEILQKCSTKKELDNAEKFWIKKLKARERGIGYNIAYGGTGGRLVENVWNKGKKLKQLTKEQRIKQSKTMIQKYKNGEIINPMTGKKPWNKNLTKNTNKIIEIYAKKISKKLTGKKLSKETKEKMSISHKGKNTYKKSKKHKEKISKILTGRKLSKQHRKNMSNARKGDKSCAGPIVKCPYCNKIGTNNAMRRWHFENCKEKKWIIQTK